MSELKFKVGDRVVHTNWGGAELVGVDSAADYPYVIRPSRTGHLVGVREKELSFPELEFKVGDKVVCKNWGDAVILRTDPEDRNYPYFVQLSLARGTLWAGPDWLSLRREAISTIVVGIKHDSEKPAISAMLHPLLANAHFLPIVRAVTSVLRYGAEKYTANNWTKVTPKERYLDAALRHLSAVDNGQWLDDESKLPHVAHAACSVLMYGALALRDRKD